MKDEQLKNAIEKNNFKSSKYANKYDNDNSNEKELKKKRPNSEINQNIINATKSLEEKLNLFEKEINNLPILKKISNNPVKCEDNSNINYANNDKIKKMSEKNLYNMNNLDTESYYGNNYNYIISGIHENKLKDLETESIWNEEDRNYNKTYLENKINNYNYNKSYQFNEKEKIFNYSNFLQDKEYSSQKERYSLQNNNNQNNDKNNEFHKKQIQNPFLRNNSIDNLNGKSCMDNFNNEKVVSFKIKNKDENNINYKEYKDKVINFDENSRLTKRSNDIINNNKDNLDNKIKNTKEKLNSYLKNTMSSLKNKKKLFEEITKSGKKKDGMNNYMSKNNK